MGPDDHGLTYLINKNALFLGPTIVPCLIDDIWSIPTIVDYIGLAETWEDRKSLK